MAYRGHTDWRTYADGRAAGVGYGYETTPFRADALVGHSGSTGVSGVEVGFLRYHEIGVVSDTTGQSVRRRR